jgi:hypothetical protein
MESMKNVPERADSIRPYRLPYETPSLSTFGSVAKLTLNGSGSGADGGTDPTMLMPCL